MELELGKTNKPLKKKAWRSKLMQQTSRPAVNLTIIWWVERTANRSAEGGGACESIDTTAALHSMDAAV